MLYPIIPETFLPQLKCRYFVL